MTKALIITKNELLQFFTGLSGYIFISVFALINAWFFAMPLFVRNIASLNSFFSTSQLLFIIFIPIITMNLISKEKQAGTIETMYTLPLKMHDFVIGKYLASFLIVMISLLPSVVHLFTIVLLGINVDYGIIFCGYLSLILTAGVYCGIGVFAGSITTNQIVSFVFSFLIIMVFFLMENMLMFFPMQFTPFLQYLSITWQNSNLIKGVIDTRVMVYFFSLIFVFLWSAINILESKTK